MIVDGVPRSQICSKLAITPRTFLRYRDSIREDFIAESMAMRQEEFIDDVKIEVARVEKNRNVYREVMNDKEESAWTRINAAKMDQDASQYLLNIKYDLNVYVYSIQNKGRVLTQPAAALGTRTNKQQASNTGTTPGTT